jgi:hypothetical protein
MKKLFAALALTAAVCTTPAFADVGISLRIGEPGFYGQIDIGHFGTPRLVYSQPVIVVDRHRHIEPIYLRVPHDHSRHWDRYCGRYNACARPVYFVRDDWYRDVYAPRYRQVRSHDSYYGRRADRHGHRHDNRHVGRDHRRNDHGRGSRGNGRH